MKVQRVLFPTDFSHYNDTALQYASTLAAEAGALLSIVHVDEMQEINAAMGEVGYFMAGALAHEGRPEVSERLAKVVPTTKGVAYEQCYLKGSPVTEILRFSEAENIDVIVMASHGRTGLPRLLMGSVAESVMRKAPCPVLIVRQPAVGHEQENKIGLNVSQR